MLQIQAVTSLGIGNDALALGLSENDDDLLTWAFHLSEEKKGIVLDAAVRTFTERGAVIGAQHLKERYDILDIRAGYGFRVSIAPVLFETQLRAGVSIIGNFGGELFQNQHHRNINVPLVDLPYTEERFARPSLLLSGSATCDFNEGISTKVLLAAEQRATTGGLYGSAVLQLSTDGLSGYIGLDYALWKGNHTKTALIYADAVSGPGITLGYDLGFLTFNYRMNFLTRRGYGYMAVQPENMALPRGGGIGLTKGIRSGLETGVWQTA